MDQNAAFEKRFSEHPSFWLMSGAVVVFLHYYFYEIIRAISCDALGEAFADCFLPCPFAFAVVFFVKKRVIDSGDDD